MSAPLVLSSSPLVAISPLPLASILDHHSRRPTSQDRVFGTLLGTYNTQAGEVQVLNSFGVPYGITAAGDVRVDVEHQRAMGEAHAKVNPGEVVVGWYSTSPSLNHISALIQQFYTSESSQPPIHLTLSTSTLQLATYIASPVGPSAPADGRASLAFLPTRHEIRTSSEGERRTVDLLTPRQGGAQPTIKAPLAQFSGLLGDLSGLLANVQTYVDSVLSGATPGDERVGRALLESLGSAPPSLLGEGGQGEEAFQGHLSDVLMVAYLAQVVRTEAEISARLNLV